MLIHNALAIKVGPFSIWVWDESHVLVLWVWVERRSLPVFDFPRRCL